MKSRMIMTIIALSLFITGCAGTQIKKSENEKCLPEKTQQQLACNDRVPATEDNRELARDRL